MPFNRIIAVFSILIASILETSSQGVSFEVPDFSGETIHYRLKYGIFNIGYASITCQEDPSGTACNIKAEAQSAGWVKIFKDLDYRFECGMDLGSGLPISATRSLRDGRYSLYNEVLFDRNTRTDSTIVMSQMSGMHVVSKNIYDILTGFYHFRENFLKASATRREDVVIKTYFTDELWDLRIRYAGEEIIETSMGLRLCYKFNPVTVIGRYFQNDDDMVVWFTKDEIPFPVKIQLNLKIGSIYTELLEYQSPAQKLSNLSFQ